MSISVCLKVIHLGPLKIHTRINHLSLEFGAIYLNFSVLTHIHPSPPPAINLFVGARKGVDLEMGFDRHKKPMAETAPTFGSKFHQVFRKKNFLVTFLGW